MTRRPRRAYAMTVALACLIFVGMMLAALAAVFAMDARGTRTVKQGAQQQQLLLAGRITLEQSLATSGPPGIQKAWHPALPSTLASTQDAELTIDPDTAAGATFLITARLADTRSIQRLTYRQQNGRWTLTSAEIIKWNAPNTAPK